MDLLKEKRELIKLIIELTSEKKIINQLYETIEKQLHRIEEIENTISEGHFNTNATITPNTEIDRMKFNDHKMKSSSIPYDIISKDICYILKNSGIPMNGSQIHSPLTKNLYYSLGYKNLVNNILPKMVSDNNLSIEKIYKGFWQYRRTEKNNGRGDS
ncbi:TPA: hypothetical protein K8F70_002647 [Listeria monocytogenes]|nr:hypothetical protein [Listeria monocytogenes]